MATRTKTPTIDRDDAAQLEAGRALVVQYLEEAHATEAALVTTLQAHISMTPAGAYRVLLDRHLAETRQQARAIERRLQELGATGGVVAAATGLVRTLVGQALALSKAPIDVLRGSGGEEKLLKNAKDECATEALEIATYDALETAAEAVGDGKTARLAAQHRGQEERMLADLRGAIPSLTHAAVLARAGGRPSYDVAETGAADNVRELAGRARPAAGVGDLPIAGYDDLNAGQIVSRLNELGQRELSALAAYERRNRNRRSVLSRIEALEASEPFPGYDALSADEVLARLHRADEATASAVRDYEGRHQRRVNVLEAAQRRLAAT
jgi:ferritin-like metal-binding protein YciE